MPCFSSAGPLLCSGPVCSRTILPCVKQHLNKEDGGQICNQVAGALLGKEKAGR